MGILKSFETERFYPSEGDASVIPLRLHSTRQLFNSLDASPFKERDLDSAAEDYIKMSMSDLLHKPIVRIIVTVPPESESEARELTPPAIQNHFEYCAGTARFHLRQHFKQARRALVTGLVFLIFCMSISLLIGTYEVPLGSSPFLTMGRQVLQESLLIVGWVVLWKPTEMFLYDWWPLQQELKVCQRISELTINIRAISSNSKTSNHPDTGLED